MFCKEYGVLPDPGGVLQQDDYLMYGLGAVIRAIQQRQEKDDKEAQSRANTKKK